MYWFVRPPYARWVAAALLVVAGLWFELKPQPTEAHWFATVEVRAGEELTDDNATLRQVGAGVLIATEGAGIARVDIDAGTALVPALVAAGEAAVPAGWWSMSVPLPARSAAGTRVLLVLLGDDGGPSTVEGLVISGPVESDAPWGPDQSEGIVAIPPERAAGVAAARASGTLTVLTASPG
ncbi:MAG: hypothetical protein OEO77_09275 [Acidimicrobiia bacterium]|nr:hypothetical protein [Acidimicrobiia bacterium]